ncbi:Uncharacterised protein [Macrococcoides caseolyticum]|nr:Uncharacterised protein [Macrococcus caseolyticus]
MKFNELDTAVLNDGWSMGAGVVVGIAGTLALGAVLT